MILDKYITVRINSFTYKHYKDLGYDISQKEFIIDVNHLPLGSHAIVSVECDKCGKEYTMTYKSYINKLKCHNFIVCKQCIYEKIKLTNLEKYGVENTFQNEEIKEKSKKTCLEKYGFEYAMKNEDVKKKGNETNLEKYGFENPFQFLDFEEKSSKTCLERYGFSSAMNNEEVKQKVKKARLENGTWIHDYDLDKWKVYKRDVNRITLHTKKRIIRKLGWI